MLSIPVVFSAEYKIAVRAHHGISATYEQWGATVELLNNEIPRHSFDLVPVIDLNELSRRVGDGEFDYVLTNPSSYVEIELLYGAEAIATLNNKRAGKAQDQFGSVIFTHIKNKNILNIKDLKGKTVMAVSEPAFGGWRVAWFEMLSQGLDPYSDLKKLMFTKTGLQQDVVRGVLNGKAQVGVVRTGKLESMEAGGEIDMRYLRIINNNDIKNFPFFLSTKLYPEWVFSSAQSTDLAIKQKVKNVLQSIMADSPAALEGKYIGWVSPRDYGSVRKLMQRLKVGPYKHNYRKTR